MASVVVLGAGMVGTVIAADLLADHAVTVADVRPEALARAAAKVPGLRTVQVDLSDPAAVTALAAQHDLVCGALASHLGFAALQAVIAARRPYCDISFMPQDAWTLDELAKAAGVTAVVDCGVAPGMSNLLCGYATTQLDVTEHLGIYVGGIPALRSWPWDYKAGFAPADVIEEYTRPSRVVIDGKVVIKEALSELERVEVPGVGTLEAFNTDGLRSLAYTLNVPSMCEKTMRWPGHVEKMEILRHLGLMSTEPVRVGGQDVIPRELLARLLFPQWTYEDGEEDLTVMRVEAVGVRGGQRLRLQWDLHDRYDAASRCTSMSRTTAFPCAIVARMILEGAVPSAGVWVPERLGQVAGVPERVMAELERRGVRYAHRALPA